MDSHEHTKLPVIGWREWVGLPDLGVVRLKAKVDTGARSSSLHASEIEQFHLDGELWVRFNLHPFHRNTAHSFRTEAKVYDYRLVKSSTGESAERPVILTTVKLLGEKWPVELTLANRNEMGFRMLLGREAVRGKFLVDSGNSYFGGRPKRKKKKRPAKD